MIKLWQKNKYYNELVDGSLKGNWVSLEENHAASLLKYNHLKEGGLYCSEDEIPTLKEFFKEIPKAKQDGALQKEKETKEQIKVEEKETIAPPVAVEPNPPAPVAVEEKPEAIVEDKPEVAPEKKTRKTRKKKVNK